MKAILAVNNLGFIGKDNKLLWRCKDDLKLFKEKTLCQKLIVGYNTNTLLPTLKEREILVDKRNEYLSGDWCIGGKKTYEKYCHLFTELHISHINDNSIGDTIIPNLFNLNPNCKVYNYFFETDK